jgi:hypothetical protein
MRYIPKKIWIPAVIIIFFIGVLSFYNRPATLKKAVLMSTPLIFREGLAKLYDNLPGDITPPTIEVFYATDRQPTDKTFLHPVFYGNDRSMSLYLGIANVRFGSEEMNWQEIEKASVMKDRDRAVPIQLVGVEMLHEIGSSDQHQDRLKNRCGQGLMQKTLSSRALKIACQIRIPKRSISLSRDSKSILPTRFWWPPNCGITWVIPGPS